MKLGQVVKFLPHFGQEYLAMGHKFGRIEGIHQYDQAVFTLRKMRENENTGELEPMNVMLYMVPEWAVSAS